MTLAGVRSIRALVGTLLVAVVPALVHAQKPAPGRPVTPAPSRTTRDTARVRPDTGRGRADTLSRRGGRDTTVKELVRFEEPDSVMKALMERTGFTTTQYQGDTVVFDAERHALVLSGKPAAVKREQTILVGDTVTYDDSTQVVQARGDTVILRDPSRNAADLVSSGRIAYSIVEGRGIITNLRTTVENSGQRWIVFGENAAVVTNLDSVPPPLEPLVPGDTTQRATRHSAFYARDGTITSCDETVPHYHFQAKEIKVVTDGVLVARPAVLYIADVPVMWLPFVFQDLRKGRRSGMLTPRFGVAELFRNSPTYHRQVENLGWYLSLNDYMDAAVSLDWRSGARVETGDYPGFTRINSTVQYRRLDWFLDGRLGFSLQQQSDGSSNKQYSWGHRQDFSSRTHLNANLNYTTSTTIARQSTYNPVVAVGTIASQLNFQTARGPLNFSIGGSQTQYPGRTQINRSFPTFSISSQPVRVGEWLTWTPTFNYTDTRQLRIDQAAAFSQRYTTDTLNGVLLPDSVRANRSTRSSSATLSTPLKIFEFSLSLNTRFQENVNNYPELVRLTNVTTGDSLPSRVFARTFSSTADWDFGFALPSFFRGSWNVTPSVTYQNVRGEGFAVRSHLSGGQWVTQKKRPVFSLSSSPTLYALFSGFGSVSRFRHSISPIIAYSYASKADVSDEFLAAVGANRKSTLPAAAQNMLTLGLATNLEAKVRTGNDTNPESGRKVRLLSLNFSSLGYDFERARVLRERIGSSRWYQGLTSSRFGYDVRSDLLPNVSFRVDYSLFSGDLQSDTAEFSPYREAISSSFSLDRNSAIFAPLYRLFGGKGQTTPAGSTSDPRAPQPTNATGELGPTAARGDYRNVGGVSLAGDARYAQQELPQGQGWRATLSLSSSRQRPIRGATQLDATSICAPYTAFPIQYTSCVANPSQYAPTTGNVTTTIGAPVYQAPPVTNVSGQVSFNLTPKWATQWQTSYDLERHQFASHVVSLQRDLHDWRATFGFTQAPNGAFAFTFYIALKAEPDLKFDYHRNTYGNR